MTNEDPIRMQAAQWHIASDSDAMDWDGFTRWLEADPRHHRAYDEIALTDGLLQDHHGDLQKIRPEPEDVAGSVQTAANDAGDAGIVLRPNFSRRLVFAAAALAATLAGVLVVPQFAAPAPKTYVTTSTPQQIALDDGSSVTLAPRSRLLVEGRDQDRMALSGGALFDIRHDPDRPLTITAGNLRISDIGTRFDIQAEASNVRVAVVEGKVDVTSEGFAVPVHLSAGDGLSFDRRAGRATIMAVQADDVGSWRQGRLSYDDAPLALVIADLRRYAGVRVDMPEAIGDRRFSGTLTVGDGNAALRDLAQVMGLRLDGRAGAWRLERLAN